ncbi:MAG: sensor histidine kinase, partial [Gemmatirosa sp.]
TVQASLADGAAHHLDYRIVRPDGAVRWLEAHGQFERDADGRVARLIGVCRDVTEQQAAREQLRLVTESIPVPGWTAGPDGGLEYVSARTPAYFGASEADLLGNGWATRVHPDDIAAAAQQWAHALATGEPYETEFRLQRADGAYRWHLARALPLRDAHGRLARWFGSNTDVDDRFVAERERDRALAEAERRADELARLATALERSNQELDQFAYVTSHDLKAPLRGIANLTQWIEEDLGDRVTGESREHMRLLKGRVHRMEALIDGILAYARAGRTRVAPEPVDTNALLREVVELLDAGAQARIAIADDLPTVVAERVPLQQVFLNLLGNAVRFSAAHRPDPVVRVGWRDAGDVVEFWVADNGPGIAPEFQERVWGIFQTLQARDKVEGTGIGLAVVRKIVDSRGGRAWLDSAPGKGTTFYIAVPRIAPCDPADAGCA